MSSKIILCADSTCDLPDYLQEKYNVKFFPYIINLDDKSYKDGIDIMPNDIYKVYYETKKLPKTAANSVGEYLEFFKKYTSKGYDVIHIALGHSLTAACDNAKMAASQLERVYVFDSCNLSTGSGLLVMQAGKMIEQGMCAQDIIKKLEKIRPHVHVSFVLDDFEFLVAGGRCPALAAKAAGLLKCKPYLSVDNNNGSLKLGKMYRGKIEKVLLKYVKDELGKYQNIVLDDVFVTNSMGFEQNIIDSVKEEVANCLDFKNVHEAYASCTISSHCGPRCLGVLFLTDWTK